MKRLVFILLMLTAVLSVENLYDRMTTKGKEVNREGVLVSALDQAGIYESECQIEGYYYLDSRYYSEEGAHELLGRLAGYMGVNGEYEFERKKTDSGYEASLVKEAESSLVELKMMTVELEESEHLIHQSQYISVRLLIRNSVSSSFYYRKIVAQSIERLMVEQQNRYGTDEYEKRRHQLIDSLNVSIKGKIHSFLEPSEQMQIAQGILEAMGAKKIFENVQEEEKIHSIYAYTDSIKDYVAIGKDRINVNVVFTYDEEENATLLHIGSPIINYDY